MTVGLDATYILSALDARYGLSLPSSSSGASASTAAASNLPKPPWSTSSLAASGAKSPVSGGIGSASNSSAAATSSTAAATASSVQALVDSLLNTGDIVAQSTAAPSAHTTNLQANGDYEKLFTLYNALEKLKNLASASHDASASPAQAARIQQAFQVGLTQIDKYLASRPFSEFQVAAGVASTSDASTVAQPVETDTYAGRTITTGDLSTVSSKLTGPLSFQLTVTPLYQTPTRLTFDLGELGSAPRTLPNVVNYLNGKLAAAGLQTRFGLTQTPGASVLDAAGRTVPGPDSLGIKIVGAPDEQLSFADTGAQPAVYVPQQVGAPPTSGAPSTSTTATTHPELQLEALSADPTQTSGASSAIFTNTLSANTAAANAVAAGPDGSLYLISTTTGPTPDGQSIAGAQDAVLTKYDSAGNIVFTRTLGAAGSADAQCLSLSPDGKSVAVVSSITGELDARHPGATTDGTPNVQTAVTVYDTTLGNEQWTAVAGAPGGNVTPKAVAFGGDGAVYVTGQTSAPLNGVSGQVSASDNYLIGFSSTGAQTFATQYGATLGNHADGVAVVGHQVVVADVENGQAVLRSFTPSASGVSQTATRNLGDLNGGDIAGLAADGAGHLIVAGSSHSATLDVANATSPSNGQRDVFVARIGADLTPGSNEAISYQGLGPDVATTGLSVLDGVAYVTGTVAGDTPAGATVANRQGFVAGIDPGSGQTVWSVALPGVSGKDAPTSVAVAAGAASSLDRLGLPTGVVNWSVSNQIAAFTSVRPGDSFTLTTGAGQSTISVSQNETFATLAKKINVASAFTVDATVGYSSSGQILQITPTSGAQTITFGAGPPGSDLLSKLGIAPGVISSQAANTTQTITPTSNIKRAPYALNLPSNLSVATSAGAGDAQTALTTAINKVKSIYSDLSTPRNPNAVAHLASGGAVPAYITAQIANYRAGLARLTSLATSAPSTSLSLFG